MLSRKIKLRTKYFFKRLPARGMGASYRSRADSPTALGKGAYGGKVYLAPFSNGGSPKVYFEA
ncbi:hypothetical protein B0A68_04105 [Flavobacterium reichenbachii]|uniref:Uncharacterized protein n=1 Tax=Flavobacterium reichenbachii TaxID=362418 RepID=A0A085ZPD6_9FLAO|nr:hypothetical protein IW19_12505 [Flavobacterium reichenbachii]OXB17486.1 hypothetical protein B0A68_04105 [Flavobacterium reichenbachii]